MGGSSVTSSSNSPRGDAVCAAEESLAWSIVAVSVAFADAVRRMLRTRVDEAWEGLWKRVITSRDLGCWQSVSQSVKVLLVSSGKIEARGRKTYKAEHRVRFL